MGCAASSRSSVVVEAGEAVGLLYAPRTLSVKVWKDEYPEEISVDSLAVAFSGGGMRSAVLCVGWLQALEQIGVLNDVKYMRASPSPTWTGSSSASRRARVPAMC